MKFAITFLLFCGLWAGSAFADTYKLSDGQSISGEAVSVDSNGAVFKGDDGKYSPRVLWGKFSQEDLKIIAAKNSKAAPFIEPFIEVTDEEKQEARKIEIKEVQRLERPAKQGLFSALASSGIGLAILGLLYAANVYAGYEISIYRAMHPALVCGVAAVAPVVGPIIFLCIPTQIKKEDATWETSAAAEQTTETFAIPVDESAVAHAAEKAAVAATPEGKTQTFPRGQFTFNRRFFETKFPNFFGVVRRDADKDMVLVVKSARGMHVADRITRISATEVHLHVQEGSASKEVGVQYPEIQEVILKHKDV